MHGAAVGQKAISIFPARFRAFLKGEISVVDLWSGLSIQAERTLGDSLRLRLSSPEGKARK
jgi:hypothetical protein